jgi:hypothetical protein
VVVYANSIEPVGYRKPFPDPGSDHPIGSDPITLTRALVTGDSITATQQIFGLTSDHSYNPVPVVDRRPPSLHTPTVGPVIYACGQVVPVGGLDPSTHVEVYAAPTQPVPIIAANLVGKAECTGVSVPVVAQPLKEGWFVAARQVSCPGTSHEFISRASHSLKVWIHTIKGTSFAFLGGIDVAAREHNRLEPTTSAV